MEHESLRFFDASVNELAGTILTELCELPLASLNLYNNKLEGVLPPILAHSPNLYELKLFSNKLIGTEILAIICQRGEFEELILMCNYFSGKIPASLGDCRSLKRVRLKSNNLSGSVPDGVWGLPHLNLLELSENSLSGKISKAISGAYNLSNLLLSNNMFSGSIPEEIGMLDNLVEFAASNNNLSGRIPESVMKLSQLVNVDLSYNQLSGELNLGGIGELSKVTDLNLSHNRFDGSVPSELGKFPVLNNLDLSWNKFSGEIPMMLQNLKLTGLNLSYNQLSGDIPPFFANDKYKTSFIGNPGLCGHQLGLCDCHCHGKSKNRRYVWILWSIFALAGVVFIIGVAWFYFRYRKAKKLKVLSVSRWKSFHKLGFSKFEVSKLLSEDNVIGSGASGKVYKVVLSNGEVVAVKRLCGAPMNVDGNVGARKDEFDAEVETQGRIRHKNIMRWLWCCCNSEDQRLLVYEYMPNGSLADLLKGNNKSLLDLPTRYKIAVDAAEGLSYLHHDCVPPIVQDVKSNNILVDAEFVA
ncbi:receptor-like protein kinase HSL1 [Glycine max]|nr:receptor-like protein kinase HSL1 [Glycine max]|eukprot:XP_025980445.1 receptor-like protein kinase HSL1 [Glycine max]